MLQFWYIGPQKSVRNQCEEPIAQSTHRVVWLMVPRTFVDAFFEAQHNRISRLNTVELMSRGHGVLQIPPKLDFFR